ncbi:PREDICTED: glycoprotein-N-acetylgalactosamine 3-beta-galactosyltransferase 1-like isoform X2 [Vollenhovia emeryi]|uniref:glycoprotein-N-acetylgalactosamine 3-beta-galactosyltransferase 1-like isoform X2 n=1 Tax=Vollenhovia emeryi TaxID=411798 RepID=UPI0005F4A0A9|nr:PREDICTED: glycoprotein-N-acetylgalactosamine 3-beta-galactosyltransferase 1-like isoform X2 [Vollenhovia emeryi]
MRLRVLKQRSVFLAGCGVGFVLPLLFVLLRNIFVVDRHAALWRPEYHFDNRPRHEEIVLQLWKQGNETSDLNSVTYYAWLVAQNLKRHEIDLDEYLYGPREEVDARETGSIEWNWLRKRVSVTCVVFVEKLRLGRSIKATWGQRCNRIYFFGHRLRDAELPVINTDVKLVSSWQLLCEAMNYIWNDGADELEWIIFVKDDTIVIPENLRYMVAPLDPRGDYYLGHPVVLWSQIYNVAQSGYVLSRGALDKVVQTFNSSEKCISGGKYWKKEDYYLGKHLSSMGIRPSDTRDQYLRGTFHGYSLQNLLWGVARPGSYFTRAVYPIKGDCCSPISVTFSASEPDKMHMLNYLLYQLRVLNGESRFGKIPARVPVREEDVWKIALQEEFNITHLSDISSEAYYEIWHSKYSEPGQLKVAKNYRMNPDTLHCLLTNYKSGNRSAFHCRTKSAVDSTKN